MSDFNYQKYLKNNPLLKKEVKDTLLTEAKDKEVEEVMGIDRKGNKKPDTDGSDASKFKRAAKDVKEVRIDRDVAERIESLLDRSMKAKFIDAFMDIYSDLLEEDNFFPEDIINHLNNEMHAELAGYQRQGDRLAGLGEDARTDAEEEGYKDGMKDEKEDLEGEDIEIDIEEPLDAETAQGGLTDDEREVQDALKLAYDNAIAMGDQKLADQIGNSITFFTRTHVVER